MKHPHHQKFHGRVSNSRHPCDWPGCDRPGEFRAPGVRPSGFNGPGEYRWFCLEHIRAFNAGYDWFSGMSPEEIAAAQHPAAGWETEIRAFRPTAGVDSAPRWADFKDPLEAISGRAQNFQRAARQQAHRPDGRIFTADERRALDVLGLGPDTDRKALRSRYSELVRRFHPDRNGGDRSHETRLQQVVEAYQLLKGARAFA